MNEKKKCIMVVSFQSLTKKSGAGMARLGYFVSSRLDEYGILDKFVVHSKGKYDTRFHSEPVSFFSRYYLFLLHNANKVLKLKTHKLRFLQELLFDWFCSFRLHENVTHLVATQPHLKRTFRKAKKMGIQVLYIPGTQEDNYMNKIVLDEKHLLGINEEDAYTDKKRIRHYNDAIKYVDKVICTTPNIYRSFKNANFQGEVVSLIGHMKPEFAPVAIEKKEAKIFKVAYVAYTVMLKGLHYLLAAWEGIMEEGAGDDMILYVGGGIDAAVKNYINTRFSKIRNVQYLGHITDVPSFLKDKDLFVVPSLVDGSPYTALEAAHYAVPIIITENCGACELLEKNPSGCWVIPIRDADAIKERILWAAAHRPEAARIGINAKRNLDMYKTEDYIVELATYLRNI